MNKELDELIEDYYHDMAWLEWQKAIWLEPDIKELKIKTNKYKSWKNLRGKKNETRQV